MSKSLKPRRGTTAENNAFVGEAYEVTYDTDKNTLVCRDGLTVGGSPMAKEADLDAFKTAQSVRDAQQDAAIAGKLDTSGGTMKGAIRVDHTYALINIADDSFFIITAGTGWDKGGRIICYGKDNPTNPGQVIIAGHDGNKFTEIIISPDGLISTGGSPLRVDTAFLPSGTVIAYAGQSSPKGCLLCNGAAVSRTTYAPLFSAIGTTYGAGDGSTTFNLPDLTDRFIQGSGTAGTKKDAGLPEIAGGVESNDGYGPMRSIVPSGAFGYGSASRKGLGGESYSTGWGVTFAASRSNSIYGKSNTVQPPALTMRYYIKY